MSDAGVRSNPFPGLRPFRMDEKYLFFGREEQTAELVAELKSTRFLTVVGTSGSGKSSLVIAGLLPELHGGLAVDSGADWEVAVMRPGGSPLTNLAEALVAADLYDAEQAEVVMQVRATLSRSGLGLVEAARQSDLGEGANLVLVVDQFEELFRFRRSGVDEGGEAGAFVRLLLEATRQSAVPIYVVLTMRSDYLGDCAEFPDLSEAVAAGVYLIPRLGREQVRRAIMGPVKVGGGEMAPRLLQKLLNDIGDTADYLPQLQHALMRTWELWLEEGGEGGMDLRHYEAVGGMAEALSRHAEEVFAALGSDGERRVAGRMFKALTENGGEGRGVRQPLALKRLRAIVDCEAELLVGVIEAFRGVGRTFLMPQAGVPLRPWTVVDLSHESLMRVWRRLVGWLVEEEESAQIFRRLRDTARLHARGVAGLLRHPELKVAEDWLAREAPNGAWAEQYGGDYGPAVEFLRKSSVAAKAEEVEKRRRERQKLEQAEALAETQRQAARVFKRFAVALGVGLVVAVGVSVWAVGLKQKAVAEEERANEAAGRATEAAAALSERLVAADLAAAQDKLAAGDGNESLAHLARALRTDPGSATAAARVMSMLGSGRFPMRRPYVLETEKVIYGAAYHPRHDVVVTQSETEAVVWDFATGEKRFLPGDGAITGRTWWSADGDRVLAMSDGRVQAWDLVTGQGVGIGIPHEAGRTRHTVSPLSDGGDYMAFEYPDGSVQVWNLWTGEPSTPRLAGGGGVLDWHFSDDGRRLCGLFAGGKLRVWESVGGALVEALEVEGAGQGDRIHAGPGGVFLYVRGGREQRQVMWMWPGDVGAGGRVWVDPGFGVNLVGFVESEGGEPLVVLGQIRRQGLWRGERYDGEIKGSGRFSLTTLELGSGRRVTDFGGAGEGTVLLPRIDGVTGRLRLPIGITVVGEALVAWDLRDGGKIGEVGLPERVDWGELSPDGQKVALVRMPEMGGGVRGGSRGYVVDLREGGLAFPEPIEGMGAMTMWFGVDGSTVYTHTIEPKELRTWDAETGLARGEPVHAWVGEFFESGDGRRFGTLEVKSRSQGGRSVGTEGAVTVVENGGVPVLFERLVAGPERPTPAGYLGGSGSIFAVWREGEGESQVGIWPEDGDPWVLATGITGDVYHCEAGGDGRLLAVASDRGETVILDLEGELAPVRVDYAAGLMGCDFSPDGRLLACSYADGRAVVWDSESGEAVMGPKLFAESELAGVRFSPDGGTLAVLSYGGGLDLVDPRTGELKAGRVALQSTAHGVRFSADGRYVVPGVWDFDTPVVEVATGEVVRRLRHRDKVRTAVFSPDGEVLACGGAGSISYRRGFIEFWDWRTGKTARGGIDAGGAVEVIEFSPGGDLLATAARLAEGASVRVWDVASGIALTEPLTAAKLVTSLEFRGDGEELVVAWDDGRALRVPLPPRGGEVPGWVASLAEGVGGKRLAARGGGTEDVGGAELEWIRREVGGDGVAEGFRGWARWLLAEPGDRAIGPGSDVGLEAYVEGLLRRGSRHDLTLALRLRPGDGRVHARVSELELQQAEAGDVLGRVAARYHSERSVDLAAGDALVLETRVRVMDGLGDDRRAEEARGWIGGLGNAWEDETEGVAAIWRRALEAGERGDWAGADGFVAEALEGVLGGAGREGERPLLPPVLEQLRVGAGGRAEELECGDLVQLVAERIGHRLMWPPGRGEIEEPISRAAYERIAATAGGGQLMEGRLLIGRALELGGVGVGELAGAARFFGAAGDRARAVEVLGRMSGGLTKPEGADGGLVTELISVLTWLSSCARAEGEAGEARLFEELAGGMVRRFYGEEMVEYFIGKRRLEIDPERVALLLGRGSDWKYYDGRGGPGEGWESDGFDDSGWKRGRGRFGYGGDGEITELSYGGDPEQKTVTTYFRTVVEVDAGDVAGFEWLLFSLQRDDGAVVYLNGEEVLRDSMPDGEIGHETLASGLASLERETTFFEYLIPGERLRAGRNLLAVEVHQFTEDSSDLGFDLEVLGVREGGAVAIDDGAFDLEALEEALGIPAVLRGYRSGL